MRLVINCGNSKTVMCIFDKNKIMHDACLSTNSRRSSDEYYHFFQSIFPHDITIDQCVVSCCVPYVLDNIYLFLSHYIQCEIVVLNSAIYDVLKIKSQDNITPVYKIGSDRIANMYGVSSQKKSLIIDAGTAITFDVIYPDYVFCGGAIFPGFYHIHKGLCDIPSLPLVNVYDYEDISCDIVKAINFGVYRGYISVIQGIADNIISLHNVDDIYITGGGVDIISQEIDMSWRYCKTLSLQGLDNIGNVIYGT